MTDAPSSPDGRRSPEHIALGVVVVVAFVLREAAAKLLSSPADESASVLAVEATARRGLPILPSDVPYLQGATLSYLLAPLHWVGLDGVDHIFLMRQLSVLAGTATVVFLYLLVTRLTGSAWIGVIAAGLLALDPRSVEWSSPVRMYALLQLLTVVLLWAAVRLVDRPSWRGVALTVVVGFLIVFTTALGTLLFPGVVLGAAIGLVGSPATRRFFAALVAGLAAAPLSFLALNRLLARTVPVSSGDGPGVSAGFVGDHVISTRPDWSPPLAPWLSSWSGSMRGASAVLIGIASLALLYGWLRRGRPGAGRVMLVVGYWVPVVSLLLLGRGLEVRYFVNLAPLAVAIVVLGVADLAALRAEHPTGRPDRVRPGTVLASVLAIAVLVTAGSAVASGLTRLNSHRIRGSDLLNASRYVAARHERGETVLMSLPPPMYLALGSADDIIFVSGRTISDRTRLYTRRIDDRLEDFWIGSRVVTSGRQVCAVLLADPEAWVVADQFQLVNPSGFKGHIADAMLALTDEVHSESGLVTVRRVRPDAAEIAETLPACHSD